ncbi:hypothetical protein CDD81_31 [Ophiocordyceps australis]|uniref:GH16 domain-containing protein n=1 Tax=Ophiocordyceps australis TaxID=1399860 RepID=A0A2C5YKG7_9HYPO|nr:hypothetical protein CDD81_31 [Ophiocordyceps australis]
MIGHGNILSALLGLLSTTHAWDAPQYPYLARIWQETFAGPGGAAPNLGNWNIVNGDLGVNKELQTYTGNSRNVQVSGGNTLQIVPWRDASARQGWTSGRIESKYVFAPAPGKMTRIEAVVRFGGNPPDRKQGIWPAFWMLGDAMRRGMPWPACGEVDIMETINGQLLGHGTVHCDVFPGGMCNEGNGIGGAIGIPSQNWQTWRVEFERRPGNWQDESVSWYMNGQLFHQIRGFQFNNYNVWASLCHNPFYILLNIAVGGSWPGYPNGNTLDGWGSMMEVGYVAHYTT